MIPWTRKNGRVSSPCKNWLYSTLGFCNSREKTRERRKKGMQKMSVLVMMAVLLGGLLGSPQVALSA